MKYYQKMCGRGDATLTEILFQCKTNYRTLYIDSVEIQFESGLKTILDRERTESYFDDGGVLHMKWKMPYVWDGNREIDFDFFKRFFVNGYYKIISINVECEAPDDYEFEIVKAVEHEKTYSKETSQMTASGYKNIGNNIQA